MKGKITQAPFFPSGFKPITVDSAASKLSHPVGGVLQPQLPREVSKEWGSSDLREDGGSRGIYLQLGLVGRRAGSSQEAQDGAERRPHKSQTEVPSSRARTQTKY